MFATSTGLRTQRRAYFYGVDLSLVVVPLHILKQIHTSHRKHQPRTSDDQDVAES